MRNGRHKSLQEQPDALFKAAEVIRRMPITTAPGTPGFVSGVIHHPGREIPIVDVRLTLGKEACAFSIVPPFSRYAVMPVDRRT